MGVLPLSITPASSTGAGEDLIDLKWLALHDMADIVAAMAGLEPAPEAAMAAFPALVRRAAPWRRRLVQRGIDDIAAAIDPGFSALLGIEAKGIDARPAALVLWRQFVAARAAIVALALPAAA